MQLQFWRFSALISHELLGGSYAKECKTSQMSAKESCLAKIANKELPNRIETTFLDYFSISMAVGTVRGDSTFMW